MFTRLTSEVPKIIKKYSVLQNGDHLNVTLDFRLKERH